MGRGGQAQAPAAPRPGPTARQTAAGAPRQTSRPEGGQAPRRGGPIDLVDPSRPGLLYRPGDLRGMREHVVDLIGDDVKRAHFSRTCRETVRTRTWFAICSQLVDHYREAIQAAAQSAEPQPLITAL